MKQVCKFCSDCDLQEHVPSLSIDMEKAIQTGVVTQVSSVEEFNHLDIDTVQNGFRLREPFDSIENGGLIQSFTPTFESGTGTSITPSTPLDEGSAN